MPVYLNALEGKGVMVITTNTYLATRDAEEMGQVYRFFGLDCRRSFKTIWRRRIRSRSQTGRFYRSDVIYTTNTSLGFDYLTENLTASADGQF